MSYQTEVLADSPVSYWRIDDAGSETGGTAVDQQGVNDGTYHGKVPLVAGALLASQDPDQAGSWTANVSNYISIPHSSSLDLPEELSVEAWVYPTTTSQQGSIFDRRGTSEDCFVLFLDTPEGGQINAGVVKGGVAHQIKVGGLLVAETWTHLVMTYDNTTLRLYKNGVEIGNLAVAGPIDTGANESHIGNILTEYYPFNGRIDEVAVYNKPLSAERIKAHYEAGFLPTKSVDTLERAESPIDREGKWKTNAGCPEPGETSATGWSPSAATGNKLPGNGAYWSPRKFKEPMAVLEIVEPWTEESGEMEESSVALYVCYDPAEGGSGYAAVWSEKRIQFVKVIKGADEQAGEVKGSLAGVEAIGISAINGVVEIWKREGGNWSIAVRKADSSYTNGHLAIEALGTEGRVAKLAARSSTKAGEEEGEGEEEPIGRMLSGTIAATTHLSTLLTFPGGAGTNVSTMIL